MAHFMRVLTKSTQTPTIAVLVEKLEQEGFVFETFPKKDDERFAAGDWAKLHVSYESRYASLMLDRSLKGQEDRELEEDVEEFLSQLAEVEGEEAPKQAVREMLESAAQIFALYVPDDISDEGWELVEFLLETLLEDTDGNLQVDGEGFFDKEGELLFAME